ncbi:MAG: hypothetical protein KC643_12675 [Nitrospira sp.]|nr:hypothetical protein [Nitrospira sp.]
MSATIKTVFRLLIRVIAVLLFVSAAILARELLHEQFNPARNQLPPSYPRVSLPASGVMESAHPLWL